MAGGAKKWFVGCGIGCGVILLITLGVGTLGVLGVKKAVNRGENIEASFDTLRERYGRPGEFTPQPDGALAADRMEVFLDIRDGMTADRQAMGDLLRTLDDDNGPKLAKVKAGFKLIPGLMDFISHRTDAMLEGGMGLGEYLYIYSLSYPVLLQKSLTDGPSFTLADSDSDNGDDNHGFHWSVDADADGPRDVSADRERKIRTYLHRIQLKMAENQLAALEAAGLMGEQSFADLQAEIGRMQSENLRLLWETDMPETIRRSLEPYRDRLETQYDPMVNLLESGLVEAD